MENPTVSILESISNVEDQALDGIKQAQDLALKATKTVVETVAPYVPDYDRPFADRVPSASQVIDNAFDFLGELLKVNKTFAHQLLDAVAPLTGEDKPAKAESKPAAAKVKAA
jgi:hypothetical protein